MQDPGDPGGALWDQMAALGWIGLSLPQEYGGAGLDFLSLSLVCQEMGRVLLPEPYLSTVAQGAHAVTLAGSDEQKRRLLPAIAEGRLKLAMAWLEEEAAVHGVRVQPLIDRGNPVRLLRKIADSADLMVLGIGSRLRALTLHRGIGSLVVRGTSKSVLLVPA